MYAVKAAKVFSIFLVVRPGAPRNDLLAFARSTDSLVLFPLGSHMRLVAASLLHADLVDGTRPPSPPGTDR